MEIRFLKLHDDAVIPTRGHENHFCSLTHDTGFDVYAVEDVKIPAQSSAVVPCGLQVSYITPGYWFRMESRSGLAFKHDVISFPGVIDNQYRGEIKVKMFNLNHKDYTIKKGERFVQIAVYPLIDCNLEWSSSVISTKRADKGFGSSGK